MIPRHRITKKAKKFIHNIHSYSVYLYFTIKIKISQKNTRIKINRIVNLRWVYILIIITIVVSAIHYTYTTAY